MTQFFLFLLIVLATSCTHKAEQRNKAKKQAETKAPMGWVTHVVLRPGEGAYSVVREWDTSGLKLYVSTDTFGGVELYYEPDLQADASKGLSYREEMAELPLLLKEASKTIDLTRTTRFAGAGVWGDLAIHTTNEWNIASTARAVDNFSLAAFLLNSKMTVNLNSVLQPYGWQIEKYEVEKARWIDSTGYSRYYKLETPPSKIPSKIIAASIWRIHLKRR